MINAENALLDFRPPVSEPRSRWPEEYRERFSRLENNRNLTRAKYEFHLANVHNDEYAMKNAVSNLRIIVRDGRLEPPSPPLRRW